MFVKHFKGPLDIIVPKFFRGKEDVKFDNGDLKIGDHVYVKNYGRGAEYLESQIVKIFGKKNF